MDGVAIALVALGAAVFGAILFVRTAARNRRQAPLRDLAARRGWHYSFRPHADETEVSDLDAGWSVLIRHVPAGFSAAVGTPDRWTEFRDPEAGPEVGLAFLGPTPSDGEANGPDPHGWLMSRLNVPMGLEAAELRPVADGGPGCLYATPGMEHALDAVRGSRDLDGLHEPSPWRERPVVLLGPFGLRVHFAYLIFEERDFEALVALGLSLRDRLASA